ncbi:ran-binding protein 10 isoform X2 [Carettochelys insculpta]|uniref:ran-binding protein 10 isoform X2 n=1 Tax=Carettochelys insculpta TaxID=44489 RepID=UPI003EC06F10
MADPGAGSWDGGLPCPPEEQELSQRLRRLYPAVNQAETPLPRSWSPKDKYNYIGLSQGNLRVHYKGHGKNHKDAASVRATHPIPAACGIYYFEVKIVSKGRDGYMGIGLSAQGVNMNRLPGWDKHSYGYHGDDGHSFCSSGTGQPYGPTFTTGDVIGCCVNLINNTCFYTKNGHSLGIAFTDLPSNLYPTVGLQTPGEIVDANFGQQPFVFDIEDYMREWRAKIQSTIKRFPVGDRLGEWQTMLQNMVSSYLVHHGYCSTATAFARVTDTTIQEEQISIKNRQRIQKLVLAGRVGEAIEATQQLYPGLLEHNPNLLFTLKCRQFVEMVNGTDSEVRCFSARSPKSQDSYPASPSLSPRHGSTNSHIHSAGVDSPSCSNGVTSTKSKQSHSKYPALTSSSSSSSSSSPSSVNYSESNSTDSTKSQQHSSTSNQETSDSEMEMEAEHYPNGVLENSTRIMNGTYKQEEILQTDESSMDSCPQRQLCGGNHAATERMIQFGRELQTLSEQLCREYGKNTMHKKMLQVGLCLQPELAHSRSRSELRAWRGVGAALVSAVVLGIMGHLQPAHKAVLFCVSPPPHLVPQPAARAALRLAAPGAACLAEGHTLVACEYLPVFCAAVCLTACVSSPSPGCLQLVGLLGPLELPRGAAAGSSSEGACVRCSQQCYIGVSEPAKAAPADAGPGPGL